MFEDLLKKIKSMRKEHRRIGEILMQNPSLILYLNASELARYLQVSPSSIVRFVKNLGFKGYPDFRRAIIESVGLNKTPLEYVEERGFKLLDDIKNNELSALKRNLNSEVIMAINRASEEIARSHRILLIGYGTAATFAELFYLLLSPTGLNLSITTNSAVDFLAKLHIYDNQTVVVISYIKHFRELVEMLSRGKRMGHKIISITESMANPVAIRSDINIPLWLERSGFLLTLTPVTFAINLIAARVAELRREDVKKILTRTKKMWEESDLFYGG